LKRVTFSFTITDFDFCNLFGKTGNRKLNSATSEGGRNKWQLEKLTGLVYYCQKI